MAKNTTMWVVLAVAVVFVISAGGLNQAFDKLGGLFGGDDSSSGGTADPTPGQVDVCDSTTTPRLDINAFDIENPGSSLSDSTNLYRKVGDNSWNTWTQGTGPAVDLEIGAQYEIVMGIDTTDQTDNSYGPVFTTDPIACQETSTMDVAMYVDEVETSISATFYNADELGSTTEAFSAGQTQTVYVKFEAGTDEYCGNPYIETSGISGPQRAEYPNILCLELNSSDWDTPESVSYKGVEMNRVSQPIRQAGSATDNTYCYEFPVISDTMERAALRLNADDTNAPTTDETAYLFCANFYINADTGEVEWGVEDEDGNAAGTDAADTLSLDVSG